MSAVYTSGANLKGVIERNYGNSASTTEGDLQVAIVTHAGQRIYDSEHEAPAERSMIASCTGCV
jgi:hypothetical protein